MICPKCGEYLDIDDVLYEESHGSMEQGYCQECDIWVDTECREVK